MTPDVLASAALPLLLKLEADGFSVNIDGDKLLVNPVSRLAPGVRQQLREHKADLLMLIRVCDDGVQERRAAFASQIARNLALSGKPMLPALVFVPGLAYVAGRCHSCAEPMETTRIAKCWRCCLAWRLAYGLPVPADLALAIDESRMVA